LRFNVHLVFVTKYRRGVLDAKALEWRQGHFAKVCEQMEARLLACDGEDERVHLPMEYPPKLAIAALVNALKGHKQQAIAEGDAACRQSTLARRVVDAELLRRERRRRAPCAAPTL
jgi:REP element-mobilizing transposase RayT